MRAKPLLSFATVLTLGLSACVSRTEPVYSVPAPKTNSSTNTVSTPGVAPALVVEKFLAAVNAKDLTTMGNLFGTKNGPISQRDPKAQVEQQMFVLANILKHEDYQIEGEVIVPGRQQEATQFNVVMTMGPRKITVPYIMVRSKTNAWLVEEIGITKITYSR